MSPPRRPHYFDDPDDTAKDADLVLAACIQQGYVPERCRMAGFMVLGLINQQEDPCAGCHCARERCGGRPYNPDTELLPAGQRAVAHEQRRRDLERAERFAAMRRWVSDITTPP